MITETKLEKILSLLEESKLEEIITISLVGKANFAQYMVICSATSGRHAKSSADKIMDFIKNIGSGCSAEGVNTERWILIDCNDIIVHIFRQEERQIYDLENLWANR